MLGEFLLPRIGLVAGAVAAWKLSRAAGEAPRRYYTSKGREAPARW